MKKVFFIIFIGMLYSQCNESNWQDFYPNMQGCNLEGANLYQANLSDANLNEANLMYADLRGADLSNTSLLLANLMQTNLWLANLSNSNLTGAFLSNAYLYQANLSNANFTNASCWATFFVEVVLENTIFDGAYLIYAIFDNNEDGYDDESFDAGALSGDGNLDGESNIIDIVFFIEQILNN